MFDRVRPLSKQENSSYKLHIKSVDVKKTSPSRGITSAEFREYFTNEINNSINLFRTCPCGEVVHDRRRKSGCTALVSVSPVRKGQADFFDRGGFFCYSFVRQTKE